MMYNDNSFGVNDFPHARAMNSVNFRPRDSKLVLDGDRKTSAWVLTSKIFIVIGATLGAAALGAGIAFGLGLPIALVAAGAGATGLVAGLASVILKNICQKNPKGYQRINSGTEEESAEQQSTVLDEKSIERVSEVLSEQKTATVCSSCQERSVVTDPSEEESVVIAEPYPSEIFSSEQISETSLSQSEGVCVPYGYEILETIPFDLPPVPQEAVTPRWIEENKKQAFEMVCEYEDWMRQIAREEFNLELPELFVERKLQEFSGVYAQIFEERLVMKPDEFRDGLVEPYLNQVLKSDQNKDQLCMDLATLKRRLEVRPIEVVRQRMDREFGELCDMILPDLEEQFETMFGEGELTPEVLQQIDGVMGQIREALNRQELANLHQRLIVEVGQEVADLVMSDWGVIGYDVQINLAVLTEDKKVKIIEKAKQVQAETEFHQIIDRLRDELQQGLPVKEDLIRQKYGNIDQFLKVLPESDQILYGRLLQQSLIKQEMQMLGSYSSGERAEEFVLEKLGFELEEYKKKEKVQDAMQAFMRQVLVSDQPALGVGELKERMKEVAYRKRLEVAGVPNAAHENMKIVIRAYKHMRSGLLRKMRDVLDDYEIEIDDLKLEKGKSYLKSVRKSGCLKHVNDTISFAFQRKEELIRDQLTAGKDELRAVLRDIVQSLQAPEAEQAFQRKLDTKSDFLQKAKVWMEKYQDNFVLEFVQGEDDDDECLGQGVCLGMVHRIATSMLGNPGKALVDLEADHIKPVDRLYQGMHTAVVSLEPVKLQKLLLPAQPLLRRRLKEKLLFAASEGKIREAIHAQVNALARSNGVFKIYNKNHAMLMQIEPDNDRYVFFDPNFGTLQFQKAIDETPEQVISRLIDCYLELHDWIYDHTDFHIAIQLLDSGGQRQVNPEDIDLDEAHIYL